MGDEFDKDENEIGEINLPVLDEAEEDDEVTEDAEDEIEGEDEDDEEEDDEEVL